MANEFGMDVQVDGAFELQALLDNYAKRSDNLAPLFDRFLKFLQQAVAEQFSTEGKRFQGQGAPGWPQLALATITARRKRHGYYRQSSSQGPAHKIGQWTGRLRQSLVSKTGMSIVELTKKSMAYGTAWPQAIIFQRGGRRIPVRTLLHIGKKDQNRLMEMMKIYIEEFPGGLGKISSKEIGGLT